MAAIVRYSLVSWLFLTTTPSLSAQARQTPEPQRDWHSQEVGRMVQVTLDSLRRAEEFTGATAALVLPDGRLIELSSGLADREASRPMRPRDRMLAGSTGKSFVAAVALSLAREGVLDLDAPLSRWLGEEGWFHRLPNGPDLTLRMLLRHRGGLPDHMMDPAFLDAWAARVAERGPDASFEPVELVRFILDADPLSGAGEAFHYTDTGYILVGLVIECATGRPYYEALERWLLEPLGLHATDPADRRTLPGLVPGYLAPDEPFGLGGLLPRKVASGEQLVYNPVTEWTGGGLVTRSSDLARWARALYRGAALEGEYRDELLDGVATYPVHGPIFGPDIRYGLGVILRPSPLGPAYGHRGWAPGYLSTFEYYPEHELAVAIQVNTLGRYDMAGYTDALARSALHAAPETGGDDGGWALLPVAFYTPETSLAMGGFFTRVGRVDPAGRASTVSGNGEWTLRDQLIVAGMAEIYPDPRWVVRADGIAKLRWPDRYYPIGNDVGEEEFEEYTGRTVRARVRPLHRVGDHELFVGPLVEVAHSAVLARAAGGLLASGVVPGSQDHTLLGVGLAASWDSRDASVAPRSGRFHTLSLAGYTGLAGSDMELGRVELDLRRYVSVGPGVLAARARVVSAWGDVPFSMNTYIGGVDGGLRGIYETRYGDRAGAMGVVEYRFPLVWRLGGVVFGGAGQVARDLIAPTLDAFHLAGGAGLRFALLPESGLNLGIDLAESDADPALYILLGEAF